MDTCQRTVLTYKLTDCKWHALHAHSSVHRRQNCSADLMMCITGHCNIECYVTHTAALQFLLRLVSRWNSWMIMMMMMMMMIRYCTIMWLVYYPCVDACVWHCSRIFTSSLYTWVRSQIYVLDSEISSSQKGWSHFGATINVVAVSYTHLTLPTKRIV